MVPLVQDLTNIHLQEVQGQMKTHIGATLAYVFDDKTTKLKSSYGTGYRFPSLFEMKYMRIGQVLKHYLLSKQKQVKVMILELKNL